MQRKLATWAVTDPSLRIQQLLRLITQPEWLAEGADHAFIKGAHTLALMANKNNATGQTGC